MYQVPASRSSVVQFVMTCPGMSHSSSFTLHMRDNGEVDDGKVWGDLCRQKTVRIAYNNVPWVFEIDNSTDEMVKYPLDPRTGYSLISKDWEILDSFFMTNNIIPIWIYCNQTWGWYDEELGNWTGASGMVRKNE